MKILQVNVVYKKGSTGNIVHNIHKELGKSGIEGVVCYGRGTLINEAKVYKTSSEIIAKFNVLKSRITGLHYKGSFIATNKLIRIIESEKPDIVHLHCINGYFVNIYKIIDYLKKSKIETVLTLHAEFMYTGSSNNSLDSKIWMIPTSKNKESSDEKSIKANYFERPYSSWKKMKKSFEGFQNLNVVSVSPWLMSRAESSVILSDKNHSTILNGIDTTNVFYPQRIDFLKEKHNIRDEKILLHVTPNFESENKGGKFIVGLAERFKNKNIKILVVGNQNKNIDMPSNIIDVGRVDNTKTLAAYYSLADLTILTSKTESFSMVCAESLSCGTPVIGFKAGGPEQISLPNFSEFIEYGKIDDLEESIIEWLSKGKKMQTLISKQAENTYAKEKMTNDYIKLYKKIGLKK